MKFLAAARTMLGTADVDLLDQVVEAHVAARRGLLERVEVDDDHVDRRDTELARRREVVGMVAPREDPAVDGRMQGLHAAVHHLGKAGNRRTRW